ncbi:hypothetical protein GN956_G11433 [Arapaima gigas]
MGQTFGSSWILTEPLSPQSPWCSSPDFCAMMDIGCHTAWTTQKYYLELKLSRLLDRTNSQHSNIFGQHPYSEVMRCPTESHNLLHIRSKTSAFQHGDHRRDFSLKSKQL